MAGGGWTSSRRSSAATLGAFRRVDRPPRRVRACAARARAARASVSDDDYLLEPGRRLRRGPGADDADDARGGRGGHGRRRGGSTRGGGCGRLGGGGAHAEEARGRILASRSGPRDGPRGGVGSGQGWGRQRPAAASRAACVGGCGGAGVLRTPYGSGVCKLVTRVSVRCQCRSAWSLRGQPSVRRVSLCASSVEQEFKVWCLHSILSSTIPRTTLTMLSNR